MAKVIKLIPKPSEDRPGWIWRNGEWVSARSGLTESEIIKRILKFTKSW